MNTHAQARASRACSGVVPGVDLSVMSVFVATSDLPSHVLFEGDTLDSYRLAYFGRLYFAEALQRC